MNTALYLLRALQIGLRLSDLECLTYGTVMDLVTESGNDQAEYTVLADQSDFDRF